MGGHQRHFFENLKTYIEYFQNLYATQNPTEPNLKGMVVCKLYRKIKFWAFDMGNCVPHSQISQKNGLSCLDQFLSQKKKLWSNSHCVNYWKLCFYYLSWSMFMSIYRASKIHFYPISPNIIISDVKYFIIHRPASKSS